jgi:beta-fructofuranosidase
MAIPRKIKLGHYNPTGTTALLYVLSKSILDEDDMNDTTPATTTRFETSLPQDTSITESGQIYIIPGNAFGPLELYIEFVSCDAYTDHAPGVISFFLRGGSIPEEYLRIVYNQKADVFFLDRGNTKVQWVHDNPFFTDKLTMTVYGNSTVQGLTKQTGILKSTYTPGTNEYKMNYDGECDESLFKAHIIVDRNIVEVFFNEDKDGYSAITSTNTFFFSGGNFITDVLVDYNSGGENKDKGFRGIKIKGRHLNLKESSSENPESPDTPEPETPDTPESETPESPDTPEPETPNTPESKTPESPNTP